MSLQDIFEDSIELTEDEVVLQMFQETENSLKECQVEYRKMATEAGLIVSPAQRKAEWEEIVKDLDISDEKELAEARDAGKEKGISAITVNKYLKAIATELGVELPTAARSSKWTEVVAAFDEDEALAGDKADVIDKIAKVGEYEDKKAQSLYNKLRRAFGWEAPASMSSLLNEWFIENLDAEKDAIVEKATELGMTEGSASYYVGVYKIVAELLDALNKA